MERLAHSAMVALYGLRIRYITVWYLLSGEILCSLTTIDLPDSGDVVSPKNPEYNTHQSFETAGTACSGLIEYRFIVSPLVPIGMAFN